MINLDIDNICNELIKEYKEVRENNYKEYLLNLLTHCKAINAELYKKMKDNRLLEHATKTESLIQKEYKNGKLNVQHATSLTEKVLEYYWLYGEITEGNQLDG
jgi:hypothetical protein